MAAEKRERSGEFPYFSYLDHEKPTIAYFTESSGGFFANEKWWLWQGVMNACRERNMNVIHVSGSDFSTNPEAVLYDILDTNKLSGILSWHSFVSSKSNEDDFLEFLGAFNPLPVVTIENKIANIPAVLIDDFFGMRKLIDHLVSVHHFKRIAMISDASWHAMPRINAYRQIMQEYGIADDSLLVPNKELDRRIAAFPDEELGFEVLITSVDGDAINIMDKFIAAGIRIPEDVAITGYNDGKNVRLTKPPITAVSLPFYRMGFQATAILYDQIQGHPVPSLTYIPLGLSIRESCGCRNQAVENISDKPIGQHPFAGVWAQRGKIIRLMTSHSEINHRTRLRVWVNQLLNSFLHTFSSPNRNDEEFLSNLKTILEEFTQFGEESMDFNHILSTMRTELIGYTDETTIGRFENMFEKARVIVAQKAVNVLELRSQLYLARNQVIRNIERSNMLGQSFDEFFEVLTQELPKMEIPGFYLVTYLTPEDPTGFAELRFAYRNGKKLTLPPQGIQFPSSQLLPESVQAIIDNHVFIIEDLHVEEEQIGYLIFECDNTTSAEDGAMYSIFSTQIGSAIKGVDLHEEVRSAWQRAEENARQSEERRQSAEEANRLKSRFLSVVSHELRNPINLITTNTKLAGLSLQQILDENVNAGHKKEHHYSPQIYLDRISRGAVHLDSLIGDILDLTRNQMGKITLNKTHVNLIKFLEETSDTAQQLCENKGLAFESSLNPNLPPLDIDVSRMRQVMLNLIGNSLKFTDQGKITLNAERSNGSVIISIIDTGIGIPKGEQSIIFDEFQQSERTSARGFGGMGLGLAISQQIIQKHNGAITVESSGIEGEGSTFKIHLPVESSEPKLMMETIIDHNLIYIYSQHEQTIQQVTTLLRNQNKKINVVPISEIDLTKNQEVHPAVILVDTSFIGDSSQDFRKIVQNTPWVADIPVIYLSGEDESFRSSMPIATMQKPFADAQLQTTLSQYIKPGTQEKDKLRLLIVDDNPQLLQSEADLIRLHYPNAKICTASNGKLALDLMKAKLPSLVLLDLMMPEVNGFHVLEAMQENSVLRNIPVIILTAQSLTDEDMKFFEKGVVAVLQKGVVDDQTLYTRVEMAINQELGNQSERRALVRKAIVCIHRNYQESITRSEIAVKLGVNEDYLTHCFSQEIGMPPNKYLNRYRIEQAKKELIEKPNLSITQVALNAGFSSQAYFSRVFRKETGLSPKQFRTQN